MSALHLIAQPAQDGFHLPAAEGEWLVWLIFGGIVAALWAIVRRTHRRAVSDRLERRRREERQRRDRLDSQ